MCDCKAKVCKRCNGTGQVFDWGCILLTIGLPLALLLDHMDPRNQITKETCPVCKGKGH